MSDNLSTIEINKEMDENIIYTLELPTNVNDNIPPLIKIGSTKHIISRMKAYKTGHYKCHLKYYYKINENCYKVDNMIKMNFNDLRYCNINNESGTEIYNHNELTDGVLKKFFNDNNIEFEIFEKYDIINEINKPLTDTDLDNNYQEGKCKLFWHQNDEINELTRKNKEKIKSIELFSFRYGQKQVYDKFNNILEKKKYWGLLIAPTGWGKSMMYYLFIGLFFKKYDKNIIFISKRKDILQNVILEIKDDIEKLKKQEMFPNDIDYKIINQVDETFDTNKFNKYNKHTIVIINSDKLITKNKDKPDELDSSKLDKINLDKFGLVLFDESHWSGANRICQVMKYFKEKIKFGIGCSATPIRKSLNNQKNIKDIFGEDYNILHEISYQEAWENDVILKVDTIIFPIMLEEMDLDIEKISTKDKKMIDNEIKTKSREIILDKINKVIEKSFKRKIIIYFRDRLGLLFWYSYLKEKYQDYDKFLSFTYTVKKSTGNDEKEKNLDHQVHIELKKLGINKEQLETGISNFKNKEEKSILFVVGRANEGYNDPLVDICINLDYSKNTNIELTLQKMGRTQRIYQNKEKGYYICPIICKNIDSFKDQLAKSIFDYVKVTEELANKNYSKNKPSPKSDMIKEIIETFKVEGIEDFTHDDILGRIALLEKQKTMTLEKFIEKLRLFNITNSEEYNKKWQSEEKFRELGMPQIWNKVDNFSWSMVNTKNNTFYSENEIFDVITKLYADNELLFDQMDDDNDKLVKLNELDSRIPKEFPWIYYNIEKTRFTFIFT